MTAQRVAAHRLTFERVPTPYGDPAADEALARDVAAGVRVGRSGMREYLRARTRFFDRVVVGALSRGCTQVVVGAAGYDGRAMRYAAPGVTWFELDHPATQQDKCARLGRLGLDAGHIRFVAADFTTDPVADLLISAGCDTSIATLFLLEGVAVYLETRVLRSLLEQLRRAAGAGSTLAVSLSVTTTSPARRRAFRARVAALGEPARSTFTPAEAEALLMAAGWVPQAAPAATRDAADRSRAAGFVLAAPSPA